MRTPKEKRKFGGKVFRLTQQMKKKPSQQMLKQAQQAGYQWRIIRGKIWKYDQKRQLKPIGMGYRIYSRKKK